MLAGSPDDAFWQRPETTRKLAADFIGRKNGRDFPDRFVAQSAGAVVAQP
jgi:hypothetical protein